MFFLRKMGESEATEKARSVLDALYIVFYVIVILLLILYFVFLEAS
jgi:hypothetical protein